jgi:excisionase family DNA binding protein
MSLTELRNWIHAQLDTIDPRAGEASEEYASVVRELKIRTLDFNPTLSLSLPILDKKYAASAVGQLRRVLEEIEQPQPVPDTDVLDPPAVARLVGCSPDTVRDWIRSGQLRAANVANGNRPLYKIRREDLDTFLESRNHTVIPRAERRRVDPDVIEFF